MDFAAPLPKLAAAPKKMATLSKPPLSSAVTSTLLPASASLPVLQRKASCACGARCSRCQTKKIFAVSQPGDALELEADRVAHRVLNMPAPDGSPSAVSGAPPAIQRRCARCGDDPTDEALLGTEAIQRKAAMTDIGTATSSPWDVVNTGGRALPAAARAFFEPRFGHDFSRVRVHTGDAASAAARAIDARAYTVGHDIVFAAGQFQPSTPTGQHLLAHELTHVVQQAASPARPMIMRAACGHDRKKTGCGANRGVLKFPDEKYKIDSRTIPHMQEYFKGRWLHEVPTPPNPVKAGKDKGRADGMKVSAEGGALNVEIMEIKPRNTGSAAEPTGGCVKASSEAQGYVTALTRIAPKIKGLSEKISTRYPNTGFRLDGHHAPKGKAETDVFAALGVDTGDDESMQAWAFYNSLQQKLPRVFKQAFTSLTFKVNADGEVGKSYNVLGYPVACKNNARGQGILSFMVNKEGGASYGCDEKCGEGKEDKDEKPDESPRPVTKEDANAKQLTAALRRLSDFKDSLANQYAWAQGDHLAQRNLIYTPSAKGFAGFWTNRLFNAEPPLQIIWIDTGVFLGRAGNALAAKDVAKALANLVQARTAYLKAYKTYMAWKNGVPGAAVKAQATIVGTAVAAIAVFVAPAIVARLGASGTAATEQATARVIEVIARYERVAAAAEAASVEAEIVAESEAEAEMVLHLMTL